MESIKEELIIKILLWAEDLEKRGLTQDGNYARLISQNIKEELEDKAPIEA